MANYLDETGLSLLVGKQNSVYGSAVKVTGATAADKITLSTSLYSYAEKDKENATALNSSGVILPLATSTAAGLIPSVGTTIADSIATADLVPVWDASTSKIVWGALPENAFKNDNNTYTAGDGLSLTGNVFSLDVATSSTLGGIKTGYSRSSNNFGVALDSNDKAYVNVPLLSSSADGLAPKYSLASGNVGDSVGVLTWNGSQAVWQKLPANAFKNDNTTYTFAGATGNAAGKAGFKVDSTTYQCELGASGVSAGTYGTADDDTLGFGGSFTIPYYTVDSHGVLTASGSSTITLPSKPADQSVSFKINKDSAVETPTTDTVDVVMNADVTGSSSTTQSAGTFTAVSVPTKKYVDGLLAASDAMVFKGVVDGSHALPTSGYSAGWTYKVAAAGTYAGQKCEVGDMIVCVSDSATGNTAWTVIQNNVDVFAGASSSTAGSAGLVKAPAAGDQAKFLRGDGTWAATPDNNTWRPIQVNGTQILANNVNTALNLKAGTNISVTNTSGEVTIANTYSYTLPSAKTDVLGGVKLVTGDMNGKAHADGQAPSLNHTHSQYLTAAAANETFNLYVPLAGTTNLAGNIVPKTGDTYDLGTSTLGFGDVYARMFNGDLTGTADKADALTVNAGASNKPVYFSGGVPVQCTYELNASVPTNAKFTDTDTKVTAVGNHYTPSGGTTTSAAGGTLTDITNSSTGVQVVTGVTKDAAGHVTGVTSVALKSINSDTKNTAGTTEKASAKLFLVGAESQAANPQTYSNAKVYVGTDNCLYSNNTKVLVSGEATKDAAISTTFINGLF